MTAMLDVAIGLTFVFLLLSLLCTTMTEVLEHVMKYRAHYLKQGIDKLLLSGKKELQQELYKHPLITSLYTHSAMPKGIRSSEPSYIPGRQFVLALLDVIAKTKDETSRSPQSVRDVVTGMQQNSAKLPGPLREAISALAADAGEDFDKLKSNIELWFNGSMDRISGWYKRRAQFVLLSIGSLVAVGVNADALEIMHALSNDSAVRASLVAAAEGYAQRERTAPQPIVPADAPVPIDRLYGGISQETRRVTSELGGLGIPIGWRWQRLSELTENKPEGWRVTERVWPGWPFQGQWREQLDRHVLGWLLTAIGVIAWRPLLVRHPQ